MNVCNGLETAVCDLDDRVRMWTGECTTPCERERDENLNVSK